MATPVVVFTTTSDIEASVVIALLDSHGIQSFRVSGNTQGIWPMSVNILIVATILQATGVWNDYLLGQIFAGRENMPMTVQLNAIATTSTGVIEYNVNTAAALLTALPTLILYFLSGRYFVRGITAGAVKG